MARLKPIEGYVEGYEPQDPITDHFQGWHSVTNVTFGHLVDAGAVDWSKQEWAWNGYNDEQRNRLCGMIEDRFYYRELSVCPPGRWRREFLRKLNELMQKYKPLYAAVEDGELRPLDNGSEYERVHHTHTEYPESMINPSGDYADMGNITERELHKGGNRVSQVSDYIRNYKSVDVAILDELDVMFSSLVTIRFNGI